MGRSYPINLYATFARLEPFRGDIQHSFFNPNYGGVVVDLGSYLYSWALQLFPEQLTKVSKQTNLVNGVPTTAWLYLQNVKDLFMQLGCSVEYDGNNVAIISGSDYQIKARDFWKSYDIELWENKQLVAHWQEDIGSEFSYQVTFFGERIKNTDWQSFNQSEWIFQQRLNQLYTIAR